MSFRPSNGRPRGSAAPLWLTVRTDWSQPAFAPGQDVVVGRDRTADVQFTDPLVSRIHLILRFDDGRWRAIDSGSANGIFENGKRIASVDILSGQSINLGGPDGPRLTFTIGSPFDSVEPPST